METRGDEREMVGKQEGGRGPRGRVREKERELKRKGKWEGGGGGGGEKVRQEAVMCKTGRESRFS